MPKMRAPSCDARSSDLCGADQGGEELVLKSWLANKTADNMRDWIDQSHVDDDRIIGIGAITPLGEITLN
jgi:hypothetical protein